MPKPIPILALLSLLLACALTAFSNSTTPFPIDPEKPFHLEFGRGSGWHGLSVVILDESGQTILSREGSTFRDGVIYQDWSTTEITLPHDLIREIASAVNANAIITLNKSYSGHVYDGTQWVFLIAQGNNQKAVYFDNKFPSAITRFAKSLDEILARGGLPKADWKSGGRALDQTLWKSIAPPK